MNTNPLFHDTHIRGVYKSARTTPADRSPGLGLGLLPPHIARQENQ